MKWLLTAAALLVVIIVGLSLYLQPNSFALCPHNQGKPVTREGCAPAGAIVAISGGDTAARTRAAVELYKHGWAPTLIFSGAAEDKDGPSNAAAMRLDAMHQGVPSEAILIEEVSENTRQNAEMTSELLRSNNISDIILVTSGYHMRRAMLEFIALTRDDNVTIRSSPTNDSHWGWWWWMTPRGWWLATSEFGGIIALYLGGSAS